jgi:hypothetical protein
MTNSIPNTLSEIGTAPGLRPPVGKMLSDWFDSKFLSKMAAFHMPGSRSWANTNPWRFVFSAPDNQNASNIPILRPGQPRTPGDSYSPARAIKTPQRFVFSGPDNQESLELPILGPGQPRIPGDSYSSPRAIKNTYSLNMKSY